jgi:hypothetical protein
MTTLIIKDLAVTEELDRSAMAGVQGGMFKCAPVSCFPTDSFPADIKPSSFSFDATQMLGQTQNVLNNNGNNVAFANGITSTVNPTQHGSNNISL